MVCLFYQQLRKNDRKLGISAFNFFPSVQFSMGFYKLWRFQTQSMFGFMHYGYYYNSAASRGASKTLEKHTTIIYIIPWEREHSDWKENAPSHLENLTH